MLGASMLTICVSVSAQLDGHIFQVTRHAECTVRVTVLEETKDGGGGHKVKLVGLALSDAADSEGAFWHADRVDWTYGEVADRRRRRLARR